MYQPFISLVFILVYYYLFCTIIGNGICVGGIFEKQGNAPNCT